MNKEQFINVLAKKMNSTKTSASKSLSSVLECILKNIKKEKEIKLIGFGTFRVRLRKARTITNPQNKALIHVPAQNYVTFVPGRKLRGAAKK